MKNLNLRVWDGFTKSFKYISKPNDFKYWCSTYGDDPDSEFPDMDICSGVKDAKGDDVYSGDKIKESEGDIFNVVFGCHGYSSTVGFHCISDEGKLYSFYGGMPDSDFMLIIGSRHGN